MCTPLLSEITRWQRVGEDVKVWEWERASGIGWLLVSASAALGLALRPRPLPLLLLADRRLEETKKHALVIVYRCSLFSYLEVSP